MIRLLLGYLQNMVLYWLVALPLLVGWRLWRRGQRAKASPKENQPSWLYECGMVGFGLFVVGLLSQAIVPQFIWVDGHWQVLGGLFEKPMEHINLIPGRVFMETYRGVFEEHDFGLLVVNVLGNIVMFMPIGFALPFLGKPFQACKRTVLLGLCLSLFIELAQLPLIRKTDVDDLWLNTLGVWLGFLCWKAVSKKLSKK